MTYFIKIRWLVSQLSRGEVKSIDLCLTITSGLVQNFQGFRENAVKEVAVEISIFSVAVLSNLYTSSTMPNSGSKIGLRKSEGPKEHKSRSRV